MRRTLASLTLLFLVSLFSGPSIAVQNPQETPQQPLYRPTGNEATVIGSIMLNGKVPPVYKFDMSADAVCQQLNRPPATTDDVRVTNQAVQEVFVYVKSGGPLNEYTFEVPSSDVVLEHKNCLYAPRVLGVRAGQRFVVVNSDPTIHNTHPVPRINQEWNMTQAPGAEPFVKPFMRPEQFMRVKCNLHPWESATVGVFAHPYFAVTDQFGNYEIRGLPPGTYKLVVWHRVLGEQEVDTTVSAGENRRLDFTFDVPEKLRSPQGSSSQIP